MSTGPSSGRSPSLRWSRGGTDRNAHGVEEELADVLCVPAQLLETANAVAGQILLLDPEDDVPLGPAAFGSVFTASDSPA